MPVCDATATSDEALHNDPFTYFGRNSQHSPIQFRHWKRRGLEPVPDPRSSKISPSETSPQQAGRLEVAENRTSRESSTYLDLRPLIVAAIRALIVLAFSSDR